MSVKNPTVAQSHAGSPDDPPAAPDPEPPTGPATAAPGGWSEDVKDFLLHANDEVQALRAEQVALRARVAELEALLAISEAKRARLIARLKEVKEVKEHKEPKAPPPSQLAVPPARPRAAGEAQWLAGVVEQTAQGLRSGQKTAQMIVQRARAHASEIVQSTNRSAAEIRKRAEAKAEKIVSIGQFDAESVLEGAHASARELMAEMQQMRQRALAQFRQRCAALQEEIDDLEARRVSLLETYAAMRRPVEDAMRVLESRRAGGTPRPRGRAVLHWLMNADPPPESEAGRP